MTLKSNKLYWYILARYVEKLCRLTFFWATLYISWCSYKAAVNTVAAII